MLHPTQRQSSVIYRKQVTVARPRQPAYWQLYLFVSSMTVFLIGVMMAQLPARWDGVVGAVWSALMIAGMSVWAYSNRAALMEAEQAQRDKRAHKS